MYYVVVEMSLLEKSPYNRQILPTTFTVARPTWRGLVYQKSTHHMPFLLSVTAGKEKIVQYSLSSVLQDFVCRIISSPLFQYHTLHIIALHIPYYIRVI